MKHSPSKRSERRIHWRNSTPAERSASDQNQHLHFANNPLTIWRRGIYFSAEYVRWRISGGPSNIYAHHRSGGNATSCLTHIPLRAFDLLLTHVSLPPMRQSSTLSILPKIDVLPHCYVSLPMQNLCIVPLPYILQKTTRK